MPVRLEFVQNTGDILGSLDTFNTDYLEDRDLARDLLRRIRFWVYSPSKELFGPNKFVGFKNMNYGDYSMARKGEYSGDRFNGTKAREAVEGILGPYERDDRLLAELIRWGQALLGPHVFDDIKREKWQFVALTE